MNIFSVDPKNPDFSLLNEAAEIVKAGGLVAFPTETVYGIAAMADNAEAVEWLSRLKKRPPDKPFSYHFGSLEAFYSFAGKSLPANIRRFVNHFCPGPVTVIYTDHSRDRKIGIRIPDNLVAEIFLTRCADPVFAPSANPASLKSPVTPQEVKNYFEDQIDALIDAGPCTIGKNSTVVELTEKDYSIIRPGALPEEDISEFFL
ncbi:MAG: threonylcarbamoyl-AMP synthase [Candidatus Aureabacteria bacterium]|nr:threonylcarbamoyl-AMP synthase [Candidatus Auribacterota bacterium]